MIVYKKKSGVDFKYDSDNKTDEERYHNKGSSSVKEALY